jgi:SAM-dependent methyltransferase
LDTNTQLKNIDEKPAGYAHSLQEFGLHHAELIAQPIMQLVKPQSLLDVGCGLGNFVKAFQNSGVKDVYGIDGVWIKPDQLLISADYFKAVNLEASFDLGRWFDCVICLEVAEHIHHASSLRFVESISRHSDTVVFSAALPGQGGQHHINEQPFGFWLALFQQAGYSVFDVFRPALWQNAEIPWWYRQNMFLLSRKPSIITAHEAFEIHAEGIRDYFHPGAIAEKNVMIANLQHKVDQLESQYNGLIKGKYKWATYLGILFGKLKTAIGITT